LPNGTRSWLMMFAANHGVHLSWGGLFCSGAYADLVCVESTPTHLGTRGRRVVQRNSIMVADVCRQARRAPFLGRPISLWRVCWFGVCRLDTRGTSGMPCDFADKALNQGGDSLRAAIERFTGGEGFEARLSARRCVSSRHTTRDCQRRKGEGAKDIGLRTGSDRRPWRPAREVPSSMSAWRGG
jgi:hypothetical protein